MTNQLDKQAPYEVWVVNHCLNSHNRITGRFDKDDAINIAQRQVVNKREFVEAKVVSRTRETVFSIRGGE